MAVARITAPARWHRSIAKRLSPDYPSLRRELLKASGRYGLTTELNSDEVRMLSERFPDDELIAKAMSDIEASEKRERARPRLGNLIRERQRERGMI